MDFLKKKPALFLGTAITLLFLGLYTTKFGIIESLELTLYDLRLVMSKSAAGGDEVVLVEIDDDSVDKMGRWPWPRSKIADGIEKIQLGQPKIIGLNILYSEPEDRSGLELVKTLIHMAEENNETDTPMYRTLKKALLEKDNDRILELSFSEAGMVFLPLGIRDSRVVTAGQKENDTRLLERMIPEGNVTGGGIQTANDILPPIPRFLEASRGLGHVKVVTDIDGKVRRDVILYHYKDLYIPSFALRLAAYYMDIPIDGVQAQAGTSVRLESVAEIPVTPNTEMLINFKGPEGSFKTYPFYDVVTDKIPPEVFRDRIVLVMPSATGLQNPVSTPAGQRMTLAELTANAVWTILNQQFIRQPGWDRTAGYVLIVTVGLIISLVLPRFRAVLAGVTFLSVLCIMGAASFYLFTSGGIWMKITYPALQLILGYLGVVSINFFVTEAGKEKIEGESAETNRMLGLSFQSQGMLDMAFDKLRKVPVDEETKGILYNLALDYERKRQFNKAASVYEYIEEYDPNYKNVTQKKQKLLQASETMVYGDGFPGGTGGDPLLTVEGGERPTLGRYEIMKQLGKGAMGVVYLGQDPRINRTTAIKTFRFTEDFEEEEADRMKHKFFREAESAGNLSHPNIVSIYDAGEEHDLAYIAMEFLDGEDFQKYTKKKNLLPIRKVISYVADIADGLDYAHDKGIVHRDIKPANIMLLKSGVVKITDFGIARITATSQTQTGVVKGTPHYMSPEQISGKKVDGRSDIFSLGAMLFQLLTGELPFRGNSPAALMHQIMNIQHPDARQVNSKIPKPLVTIINKALTKDRKTRYQRAAHLSKHLNALGAKIDAIMAQKKNRAES